MNLIDKDNFFVASQGEFEVCEMPTGEPDVTSPNGTGSEYHFTKKYLIRVADHWSIDKTTGAIGACRWWLNKIPKSLVAVVHPTFHTYTLKKRGIFGPGKSMRIAARIPWSKLKWVDKLPAHKSKADLMNQFVKDQGRAYLTQDIMSL